MKSLCKLPLNLRRHDKLLLKCGAFSEVSKTLSYPQLDPFSGCVIFYSNIIIHLFFSAIGIIVDVAFVWLIFDFNGYLRTSVWEPGRSVHPDH